LEEMSEVTEEEIGTLIEGMLKEFVARTYFEKLQEN